MEKGLAEGAVRNMIRFYTKQQMQQMERAAVGRGTTMQQLMEEAGAAAVRHIRKKGPAEGKKIAILCGKGNNGGDGFVCARLLSRMGARVAVILAEGFPASDLAKNAYGAMGTLVNVLDWQKNPETCRRAVQQADVIVDGLYGFSFHGELRPPVAALTRVANGSPGLRISLDLPSGVECDTGKAGADTFCADETVAFSVPKVGHALYPGARYTGKLCVVPAGIETEILDRTGAGLLVPEKEEVRACLPERDPQANKGTFGRLLCLCGSYGMAGAAALCAGAALRCGAGLVDLAVPERIYPILAAKLSEPIFTVYPEAEDGFSPGGKAMVEKSLSLAKAVVVGCGLGRSEEKTRWVTGLVRHYPGPMVVDADALRALEGNLAVLNEAAGVRVLTPHPGEMGGLLGLSAGQVQENRLQTARDFAVQYPKTVLVLKGAGTLIARGQEAVLQNTTGNAGMARGGSGDMLAGMIGAFLAQGMEAKRAAMCGVYLHGLAGDLTAREQTQNAMLPTDMIARLPQVFREIAE